MEASRLPILPAIIKNLESSKMDIKHINTIRELKEAGYQRKTIKEEIRQNLIEKLQNKEETFQWYYRL